MSELYDRAIAQAKTAKKLDDSQQYAEAVQAYITAGETFLVLAKHEKLDYKKNMYKDKAIELTTRGEKLKEYLDSADNNPGSSEATASAMKPKNAKKAEDDEKTKLQGQLQNVIVTEKPNVSWADIAGLDAAKQALKEAVVAPLEMPQFFTHGRTSWKGILLYGPPGTGKTYLAKAAATACQAMFFAVTSADLLSKWHGDSEKAVKGLFEMARSAAESGGAIIFMDEIDSMASKRTDDENEVSKRVKTELLAQMDGFGSGQRVLVLAATNTPWLLDEAIRRRFQKRIYIPLPDAAARAHMIRIHLRKFKHNLTPAEYELLSQKTSGFSGSDISVLIQAATMLHLQKLEFATHYRYVTGPHPITEEVRDDLVEMCPPSAPGAFECTKDYLPDKTALVPPPVTFADIVWALQTTRKSVGATDLERFVSFTKDYGQECV